MLSEETFEIVSGYRFVVTQGEGAEVDELASQLPD
jgi:hypothetical protein